MPRSESFHRRALRCQAHIQAYNLRKEQEPLASSLLSQLLSMPRHEMVVRYDTKDTGDGQGWYLVSAEWVNSWKRYVKSERAASCWARSRVHKAPKRLVDRTCRRRAR